MLSLNNFFPSHILAFTSHATMDFRLNDDGNYLNESQKVYLNSIHQGSWKRFYAPKQVHGSDIIEIESHDIQRECLKEADAVITSLSQIPIAVRTADCLPLFIYDVEQEKIAVIHAGWKSAHQEIVAKTIQKMRSNSDNLLCAVGPYICGDCYEVGEEFKNFFPKDVLQKENRLHLDLGQVVVRQLSSIGVVENQIYHSKKCTFHDSDFHSYRRDNVSSGRMLSLMMKLK